MNIGYLIPEFPGQTHIWMWREISHLREWGLPIRIFSTRRPSESDRARHGFAESAEGETEYLWPVGFVEVARAIAWAMVRHPVGFLRAVWLGMTLPVDRRPPIWSVLPLIAPACVLARGCVKHGVERLHSQSCANSAILCMMVKRLSGMEYSLTLNADIGWWGGAMREKLGEAEFTVTHSQWILDQIRREHRGVDGSRVMIARVGVDTRRWVPGKFEREESAEFRIITVGRLHQGKGHDVLFQAMKILVEQGNNVTLRLCGAGPEEANLRRLAGELRLSECIRFLGSLSEEAIIEEMKKSDCFALATHAEGLGVVFIEAMAMGLATVGTDVGGVREIITHGEDGLLVADNDSAALAAAIGEFIHDPPRRRRLGEAGRQTVLRRFDSRIGATALFERWTGKPPIGENISQQDTHAAAVDR